LQSEIDVIKSNVRQVTPPDLIGDLDQLLADVETMAGGMRRAGGASPDAAFAQFTVDENAAADRLLTMTGKRSQADASGNITITFPNALAAWVSDPCGPKPLQQTVKGTWQPVGNSLN
jgi:hypothetical protein